MSASAKHFNNQKCVRKSKSMTVDVDYDVTANVLNVNEHAKPRR